MSVYEVEPNILIETVAQDLKAKIKKPEWTDYVKTGHFKERAPENRDWWYYRVAAILRKLYVKGPMGVETLARYFGGRKNRGVCPHKFYKGSRAIIRRALQTLEELGFVEKIHEGRKLTPKGQSYLDKIANLLKNKMEEKK